MAELEWKVSSGLGLYLVSGLGSGLGLIRGKVQALGRYDQLFQFKFGLDNVRRKVI